MAKRVYKDTPANRKLGRVGKEIPSKAKAPAKVVKKRVKDDDSKYDVEGRKDRSRVKSTKYVDEADDSSNPMKKKSSKPVAKAKPKKKVSTTPPAKKEEKKAKPPPSKIKGVSAGTMEAYRKAKAKRAAREAAKSKATPPKKIAENGKRGDAKYNEEYSKQLMKKRALQKEVKTKVPKYLALKKKLGGGARVDKDGKPVPAPRKAKTAPVPAPRKKKEKPVPKPRPKPKPPSYKEITKPKAKAKAKAKVMKPDTPAQAAKFANAILEDEDARSETLDQQIERKFAEHKIQKKNQNQKPKAKGVQALLPDKSSYIPPKVAKTTALANPPSKLEPPKKAKKAGRKSLRKSRSNLKKKLKKKGMKIKIGVPKDKGSTPEVVKSSEEKSDVEKSLGELHGFGNVQSLADLFQGLSHIEPNLVNKIADSVDTEERQNGLTFDEYYEEAHHDTPEGYEGKFRHYWGEYIDDASYSGRYAEGDDEMEALSDEASNYAKNLLKDDWRKEGAIAKNADAIAKTPALTERKGKKRAVKSSLELKGVGGKGGGVPPILKKTTPSRVKKAKGIAEKPKEKSATELFYKGDEAGAKAKRLKDASAFNKLYGGNTAKAKQTEDEETAYFSKLFPNPNYKPPPPKPRPGKARNLDYGKLKVSHLKLLNDAEKAKFRKLIVKKMDNDESLTKAEAKEWAAWLKTQGGFK